jgi:hypothetical protein
LTFLGSILVTLLVGGFFMFGGFGLGCLLSLFLPAEWFEPATMPPRQADSKDRSSFRRAARRTGGVATEGDSVD